MLMLRSGRSVAAQAWTGASALPECSTWCLRKKLDYTCFYIGGGVGVLGLVVAVIIFLLPPVSTSTTMLTTKLPYDCNAGYANWQSGWSISKKAWCCEHAGRGCTTTHPPTHPPPHPPRPPPPQ